jgi:hypothetical protein
MFLRALGLTLLALAGFLLVPLGGCGTQSRANDGGHVDWSSFTPKESSGIRSSNLAELSSKAGFQFVLPSYLPPGMSHTIFLSPQIEPDAEGWGFVDVAPENDSFPVVGIKESRLSTNTPSATNDGTGYVFHPLPETTPMATAHHEYDIHTIDGVLVKCHTEMPDERVLAFIPTPYPGGPTSIPGIYLTAGLVCEWENEGISFSVGLGWRVDNLTPIEIAPERRDEVLKVVTSMIEAPYTP